MAGKKGMRVPESKQLRSFRSKSAPKVEEVFERTMKLVREQIKRVEELMFSEKFWDAEARTGKYSSDVGNQLTRLGQVVTNLGNMYLRIQKVSKENADLMTFDEKLEAIEDFLSSLGAKHRLSALEMLYPVIHVMEGKKNTLRRKRALDVAHQAAQNAPQQAEPDGHQEATTDDNIGPEST